MKFLLSCLAAAVLAAAAPVHAQGTAFHYRGHLTDNGQPANGSYDFMLWLFDAGTNGSRLSNIFIADAVPVTNGWFDVSPDFGNVFPGAERWLQVCVKSNSTSTIGYYPLEPRQKILPVPYAITAGNLSGTIPIGQVTGVIPLVQLSASVVTNNQSGVSLDGTFAGNGGALTSLNYDAITNTPAQDVSGLASALPIYKLTTASLSASQRQLRILYVGDSMSDFRASPTAADAFHRELAAAFGEGGAFFPGNPGDTGAPDSAPWPDFTGQSALISQSVTQSWNQFAIFNPATPGRQILADEVGIVYLAWPSGGSNRVTSWNGSVSPTTYSSNTVTRLVDYSNNVPEIRVTNWFGWNQTNNVISLQKATSHGTNITLGCYFLRTNQPSGIVSMQYALSACNVGQLTNIGVDLLTQLGNVLKPDLVIYHAKDGTIENSLDIWTNALPLALHSLRGGNTNGSIIMTLTPPQVYPPPLPPEFKTDNDVNRMIALHNHWFVLDLAGKFSPAVTMMNMGILRDSIHPSAAGAAAWAHEMARQLGLDSGISGCGLTTNLFIPTNTLGKGMTLHYRNGVLIGVQ